MILKCARNHGNWFRHFKDVSTKHSLILGHRILRISVILLSQYHIKNNVHVDGWITFEKFIIIHKFYLLKLNGIFNKRIT